MAEWGTWMGVDRLLARSTVSVSEHEWRKTMALLTHSPQAGPREYKETVMRRARNAILAELATRCIQ